ncbi:hypothetical protein JDV09_12070 [Mycobacterium sp. Y57]|nr:hypothetical protein [Mycolicibacterium xanthum]MBX7432837.1 hypothetical protein [Mycolicibacterium xanthum]
MRRRLRHLRRKLQMRRETAHPAVGFVTVATLFLLAAGFVAYALTQH